MKKVEIRKKVVDNLYWYSILLYLCVVYSLKM